MRISTSGVNARLDQDLVLSAPSLLYVPCFFLHISHPTASAEKSDTKTIENAGPYCNLKQLGVHFDSKFNSLTSICPKTCFHTLRVHAYMARKVQVSQFPVSHVLVQISNMHGCDHIPSHTTSYVCNRVKSVFSVSVNMAFFKLSISIISYLVMGHD